jgi:hypothetical protein
MDSAAWRDWHFGDEPCPYSGGCSEPVRSHYHHHEGPGKPVVVIYYDQPLLEQAYRQQESRDGT